MRAVLRSLPVFAPTEVNTITGLPRRSPPFLPFVASYCSVWLRAQAAVLGSYSPVSGMDLFLRCFACGTVRSQARLRLYPPGGHGHDRCMASLLATSVRQYRRLGRVPRA